MHCFTLVQQDQKEGVGIFFFLSAKNSLIYGQFSKKKGVRGSLCIFTAQDTYKKQSILHPIPVSSEVE